MAAGGARFITLEGGEGSGKSTQTRRLAAFLESRGLDVTITREPGGSPGAEEIRKLLVEGAPGRWSPLAEAMLHSAARADHVAQLIKPALERGHWVISDRFTDSTLAYQGYGHGLDEAAIVALNGLSCAGVTPDLTLILDLPVEEGLNRARTRGQNGENADEDRYERMDAAFHQRLRAGYLEIAGNDPERCVIIDASGGEDDVETRIRETIETKNLLP